MFPLPVIIELKSLGHIGLMRQNFFGVAIVNFFQHCRA